MVDDTIPLATARAERENNASAWKPRDVLIQALRDIDSGLINPDELIVCYHETKSDGEYASGFLRSGKDVLLTIGVLEDTKHKLLS